MRLNKFIASATGKSRREADDLIVAGRAKVNGKVARLGTVIDVTSQPKAKPLPETVRSYDEARAISPVTTGRNRVSREDGLALEPTVTLDGKKLTLPEKRTLVMLNKPVGYVSSRRAQAKDAKTLYELLPPKYRKLKTVGRLDRDSSGLILLTDDGDLAFSMTHPKFAKTKIYEVELDHPLEPLHQQMISDFGIELPDGKSRFTLEEREAKPNPKSLSDDSPKNLSDDERKSRLGEDCLSAASSADNRGLSDEEHRDFSSRRNEDGLGLGGRPNLPPRRHWRITMHEGRNRQIRRTFAALGYTVTKLHRTDFGNYHLDDLTTGQWKLII
ncbi:pseudouridine synthase [Candidatus Saccharibacteria bacterium]|nr:pseudouridine synthase [Candidatus Saccharibacteria bacterium]